MMEQSSPLDVSVLKVELAQLRQRVAELEGQLKSAASQADRSETAPEVHTPEVQADSEERYRWLFENSLYGMILVQSDGAILSANPQACRMLGMTEAEVIQFGRSGVMVADENLSRAMMEHVQFGRVMAEITLRRKDGSTFPAEGSTLIYRDVDGTRKTNITFQDITQRKLTEARLRESEQKYRSLVENINDLVCEVDLTGNFLYLNPKFKEVMGYEPDELLGTNVLSMGRWEENETGLEKLRSLVQKGSPSGEIWQFRHKNGEWRWIETRGSVMEQQPDQPSVVMISRDITEKLDADQKLKESEETLKRAQRLTRLGTWKWNIPLNSIELSEELYQILGIQPRQESPLAFIRRVRSVVHPDDLQKLDNIRLKVMEVGKFTPFEVRLVWPDGSIHAIYADAGDVTYDYAGNIEYLHGIVLDITERRKIEEDLGISQERLNQAVHIAKLGIWDWDLTTGKVEWNDEMFPIYGIQPDEFSGRWEDYVAFTRQDYREILKKSHRLAFEQGMTESEIRTSNPVPVNLSELCIVRPDGSECFTRGEVIGIVDENRQPLRMLGIIQDITAQKLLETHLAKQRDELSLANQLLAYELLERQRIEAALRENRSLTQAILDHSPSLIYIKDLKGRLVLVNHQMEMKFHQTREELYLKTSYDLQPKEIADTYHQHDLQVMESGNPSQFEEIATDETGERVYLSEKFPLYDENMVITGVCGLSTDITERRAAEDALREAEWRYKIVAENTYDWVFWIDPSGKYVYNSPSCERVTGYPAEALKADPDLAFQMIEPEDRKLYLDHQDKILAGHEGGQINFRIVRKNGEVRWVEHSCQPVMGPDGTFLGERGSNRDFTERKRAESLVKELEVLRGINQLRDELISSVSHELRTPLGLILVMVTALRKDDLSLAAAVRQEFLQGIEEETLRLQGIVSNLLDTSLLQSGRMMLNLKVVDLSKLILKWTEQMRMHAPRHTLIYQHPSQPVMAEVDAQRIEQVLLNLLDNAIKYSPPGTKIKIKLSQTRTEIRVKVQNEGKPLPVAEYERIFDRFYRIVDRNGPITPGLGLGLPISRGILEAHRGKLWGEGWPEGGSIFTFTLPLAPEAGNQDQKGMQHELF